MSSELKFSLNMFRQHNLPNLLINIWSYSHCRINGCSICELFVATKEKWSGFYHDFNEVLKAIESDSSIHKIQNVSTERKDIIYKFKTKRSYGLVIS